MTPKLVPPSLAAPADIGAGRRPYEGVPFIAYIRVSTWKEEKISPELQRAAIDAWADRTGARIVDYVIDLDESGRHFKRKITRCVERCEAGEAAGVAVWKYSRFGRDRTGTAIWLARLEAAGGRLESATEAVDASTAIGRFQRGMLLEFAAFESDRAGEQWTEAHQHRRGLGLPATGRPRFGYIWHPRRVPDPESPTGWRLQEERYELDEAPARAIADAYRAHVDGDPFYALVGRLNADGWRTTGGRLWYQQALIRYMDSGFPAGLLRVHDPSCPCRPRSGSCPNHDYIIGAHEEAIDADLWQAYLQRRQEVKNTPPRARRGTYPLTGLARHAACRAGASATATERGGTMVRGHAYQCVRRGSTATHGCTEVLWVHRADVEAEVVAWLRREVAPAVDALPQGVPQQRDDADAVRARAARARARAQADVERQRRALANLRAERAADPDAFGPGEYEDAVAVIRGKLADAERALDALAEADDLPDRAEHTPIMLDLLDAWPHMTNEERNRLLKRVARRVSIRGNADLPLTVEVHPVWEPDPWASSTTPTP